LQWASLDDGSKEEIAQGRIVSGVAQDGAPGGFFKNCPVHVAVIGRSNDQVAADRIFWLIGAIQPLDLSFCTELPDGLDCLWCDHANGGAAAQQALYFFETDKTGAHHQASLPLKLQE
jgi:hypothetical protein